jgi:hypothetical protein
MKVQRYVLEYGVYFFEPKKTSVRQKDSQVVGSYVDFVRWISFRPFGRNFNREYILKSYLV